LFDALPCAGIVQGDSIEFSGGELQLDERQAVSLGRQIVLMYVSLAEQLRASKLSAKDREHALAYLSWANACFASGQHPALDKLGKHVTTLRSLTSTLVAPILRDAVAHRKVQSAPAAPPDPAPERAPEPEAGPAPQPPISTPPRSAPERLLAALYEQLQWARGRHGDVLDQLRLARLELLDLHETGDASIARIQMSGIAVNTGHPLVARLLAPGPIDPIDLTFVVAAIYTLMNHVAEDITDDDERVFVAQLAETLALSLRTGADRTTDPPRG
jgi:hypothetical protein